MWQRWLRLIRNFFGFSRGEARGFSVMVGLLLLVYAGWFAYRLWPAEPYQPWTDQRQLDSLISQLESADTLHTPTAPGLADKQPSAEPVYFPFDPNTLPADSLMLLGFPPWLAQRLDNYRSKGGRFRKKEDLLKLYGLPEDLYAAVAPWIRLAPQAPIATKGRKFEPAPAKATTPKPKAWPVQPFDLNKADSLQLQSIYGIGPVLSSRIIKFRDGLGGFVHPEQLREVWGLPPETADSLLRKSFIGKDPVQRKLHINVASAAVLQQHPYISPRQAAMIVAYRDQNGPYQKPEDLLHLHLLDENFVNRLKPYLHFGEP